MDLEDLRVLMEVVQSGSFQAASHTIDAPRTRLRRQVERLEEVVGVPLLRRGVRGVQLTAAGEKLTTEAGPLLSMAASALSAARAADGVPGKLRLIVPVGIPVAPRALALQMLEAVHPELELDVLECEDPISYLRNPFDLMLHFGDLPAPDGWFSRVVLRFPVRLVASRSYIEQRGAPASPSDLAHHRLFLWRGGGLPEGAVPLLNGGQLPVSAVLVSGNMDLLSQVATAGLGIALLPVLGWDPRLRDDAPLPILSDQIGADVELYALSHHATRIDPRLQALARNLNDLIVRLSSPRPA